MMLVNGQVMQFRAGLTLHTLLDELKIDPRVVVVMHQDSIYKAGQIPDAPLAEADVVEIVTMRQGG